MSTAMQAEFLEWWADYPRKIGKLAAEKAYEKARKTATAQELREGVGRYIRHKPSYADYAHPKTWLTQGRWLDQYDAPMKRNQEAVRDEMADYHAMRQAALDRQRSA